MAGEAETCMALGMIVGVLIALGLAVALVEWAIDKLKR